MHCWNWYDAADHFYGDEGEWVYWRACGLWTEWL